MIKKILLILTVAAGLFGCGGGNSASDSPVGVNPGVASRVELTATSYVNQTNGFCFLKTKVIDGNGLPIPKMEVIFTNLSLTGVLDHTSAVTGANGVATATLFSTTAGFATIQSEVNTGTEKIRDRKTVFFSPFDIAFPIGPQVAPALALDVDSDNDNVFNEPNDFIMFEPPTKTDAVIRATVTDNFGAPVLNSAVTFGADSPEVSFPLGSDPNAPVVHTNSSGQASVLARVSPLILRTTDSTVNITASADNGTFNVLTLFLKPVTVSTVTVIAVPSTIASAATSAITAAVTTTAGTPVPDGTTVNFSVTGVGSVTSFAQTTGGIATATYTAPAVVSNTSATVRASVGAVSGSATVNITAPVVVPPPPTPPTPPAALVISPTTATLSCLSGSAATFFISGGTPPYTVQAAVTPAPITILPSGSQFSVRANACGAGQPATQDVNVLINDSGTPIQVVPIIITVTNP